MVLDTNILIAYLNGEEQVVGTLQQWRLEQRALVISAVTFVELLALPTLTQAEINVIKRFLRTLLCIPLDERLAEEAARLVRTFRLRVPDAVIAATALACDMPLVSRDRAFRRVEELRLVEV